ncbi:DHCW motif cupin fold protein [Enterovibrio sp. ZSDZ42]|uniref:DHCW motif cupin fold protein n=2 Tax=Enterovibrio gelatinilyticus TaxID=2899819 RepID=A0ABT5R192_9GAMM|nr:DHCW motif cupin fold protein [Enterovibrio sp. ZSDZ42]MDD1793784.1 DHCW motif cupin fold protein [Enterovibrio sp. ZSDZ42]
MNIAKHKEDIRMEMKDLPFGTTDWEAITPTEHTGETGVAYWRTQHFGDLRVRIVEYSAGYLADHWCSKGHILFCLSGELTTELEDGSIHVLKPGMSYQVADNAEAHRSSTEVGAKLFVVD